MSALHALVLKQLAEAGLTKEQQQEFANSLSRTINSQQRYFPSDPEGNVSRVREFLWSAMLPQMGPIIIMATPDETELVTRAQAWDLVRTELLALNDTRKPLEELHSMLAEFASLLANNEFPLNVAPR